MKKPNGCHNCRFLDAASGGLTPKGRFRKGVGYLCTWPWPEIALPESMRYANLNSTLRMRMWPLEGDGENCRTWEAREDGP